MSVHTLEEIRNRMRNVCPEADVSITFASDDSLMLYWHLDGQLLYELPCVVNQVSISCRSFERLIHEAKRIIKGEDL